MLAQTWVNGIAIAVVTVSLVQAWRATHPGRKRPAKPAASVPGAGAAKVHPGLRRMMRGRRAWLLLRNEAEIARRRATAPSASTLASTPATRESAGPDQQAR